MVTNSTRLYDAFEVCLAAIGTGVDLETCLALYADLADELRPALQTAQHARPGAPVAVSEQAMTRSRSRMQARAAQLRPNRRFFGLPAVFPRLALAALAVVLAMFLSLNGLAVVSAKALPGDTLYPVKRAAENVRLQFAGSAETRLHIEEQYQQRRADEIQNLLSQSSVRSVSFEGIVEQTNGQQLLVEGIPIGISPDTKVIGEILPGRLVEVEGSTHPGGWIEAHELHLRFFEYAGELKEIQSGLWTIGDEQFKILRGTHLVPALKVGDQVLALVYSSNDGSQYAQAILRLPEELTLQQDSFKPFEIEFSGVVEAISGDSLVISGKTVLLTGDTEIAGEIAIGALVEVHASVAADGSLTAHEIEPEDASDSSDDSGQDASDDDDFEDDDQPGDDSDDASDDASDGADEHDGQDDASDDADGPGDDDHSGSSDDSSDGDDSDSDDDSSGDDSQDDDDQDDDSSGSDDDSDDDGSDDDNSGNDDDHSGGDDDQSDDDNSGGGEDED